MLLLKYTTLNLEYCSLFLVEKKRRVIESEEEEEEEFDDFLAESEDDDFIDDSAAIDVSSAIRDIFGYDKRR